MLREGNLNEDWRGALKKGAKYATAAAMGAASMYGAEHPEDMSRYGKSVSQAFSLPSDEDTMAEDQANAEKAIDRLYRDQPPGYQAAVEDLENLISTGEPVTNAAAKQALQDVAFGDSY